MDDLSAELEAIAAQAGREGAKFSERIRTTWALLEPWVAHAARAWSGSRIGYHADIYIDNMEPARPGEVWDATHGPHDGGLLSRTRGDRWMQWDPEGVFQWLLTRAGLTREDMKSLNTAAEAARAEIRTLRDRVLPVIDALAAAHPADPGLQRAQSSIGSLKADLNDGAASQALLAGHYQSTDMLALTQGPKLAVHEHVRMQFATRLMLANEFDTLARECRYVRDFLRTKVRFVTTLPSAPADVCTVLLLAANPDQDLALDEEVRAVQESIRASEHRTHVTFLTRHAVRPADLLRAMNELRPAVVHFSGHGNPQTAIYLHDGAGGAKPVKGAALEMMFDATGCARVVVLASCYSATQAKAIVKTVDCVVGMKRAIADDVACAFSGAFYGALGSGCSVADAFKQGRAAIALEGLGAERVPELLVRQGVDAAQVVLVRANADRTVSRKAGV